MPPKKKTTSPKKNQQVVVPNDDVDVDVDAEANLVYENLTAEEEVKKKIFEDCLNIENNSSQEYKVSLEQLKQTAPKVIKLIETIKLLDERDRRQNPSKLYKHYIYTNLKSLSWSRNINLIEAAFKASGYFYMGGYEKDKKISTLDSERMDSQTVIKNFNARSPKEKGDPPSNIFGERIRFLGLSSQYKEGIDLFDVKYVHIFEEPKTNTDLYQIIGRGTRLCGQLGLEFPWDLEVYTYKLKIPYEMRNLYKDSKGQLWDLRNCEVFSDFYSKYKVGSDLYTSYFFDWAHFMSIDFGLTQNYIPLKPIIGTKADLPITKIIDDSSKQKGVVKDLTFKAYESEVDIDDLKKLDEDKDLLNAMNAEQRRLSKQRSRVQSSPSLTLPAAVSTITLHTIAAEVLREAENPKDDDTVSLFDLSTQLDDTVSLFDLSTQLDDTVSLFDLSKEFDGREALSKHELNQIDIYYRYYSLKWPAINPMKSGCDFPKTPFLAELNPTQKFLMNYFQPSNPLKGMLLWHTVGSGKTCTLVSLASGVFEEQGWRIILVTRGSLKNSFYKNIFDTVCHQRFKPPFKKLIEKKAQDEGKNKAEEKNVGVETSKPVKGKSRSKKDGHNNVFLRIPDAKPSSEDTKGNDPNGNRKKLLNNSLWTDPLTYKKFANLCGHINNKSFSKSLDIDLHITNDKRHLNDPSGREKTKHDPLYKTLIIIDEAHYYLKTEKGSEALNSTDRNNIQKALMDSYEKSGADSAKVLLLTATPINTHPYEFVTLMNLLRPRNQQIPINKNQFTELIKADMENPGSKMFDFISNYISGFVSYLDRTSDAALFAQPVREDVIAEMTKEQFKDLKAKVFKLTKNTDVPIETFKPPSKDNLVLDANKDPTAVILATLSADDRAKYIGFVKAFLENKINHILFDKNKNDIFSKYPPLLQMMKMETKPRLNAVPLAATADGQGELESSTPIISSCSYLFEPYGLEKKEHFKTFLKKADIQRPNLSKDDITTLDEMKECVRKAYGYSGQDNYKDLLVPKGVVSKMLSYVGLDDGVDKVINRIGRSRRLKDGSSSQKSPKGRRRVDGNYFKKRKSVKNNDGRSRRNRL